MTTPIRATTHWALRALRHDQRGASLVEYGFLVALIALVAFAAVAYFGVELNTTYEDISARLNDLNSG